MPGAGTRPDTTTPEGARLLDLTRLVSRAGRGAPTGVDRVEYAYLGRFLADTVPCFAIVRTRLGFILLNRSGMRALADRISGDVPWGPADALSLSMRKMAPARRRAESDLRRLRIARCLPRSLSRMLRHLPAGTTYFNVGHSNLNERMLNTSLRAVVMIHDTIPLDHPEFSGDGVPEQFRRKMLAVGRHADLVLYNSLQSRTSSEAFFAARGRVPTGLVAHLGVEPLRPHPQEVPKGLDLSHPYFVTVGTIEPRKDHALLLDIWEDFHANPPRGGIPHLFILGRRGWRNADVFDRLDTAPYMGKTVFELPDLSDGAMAALLQNACALLFPSQAEGYGLPPLEAAQLGTPAIVSDLAIYRETLSDFPVYVTNRDKYLWRNEIERFASNRNTKRGTGIGPLPTWEGHFRAVLSQA